MSGIFVSKQCEGGTLIELSGEFDLHDLERLRTTLGGTSGRVPSSGGRTMVDLSGVTFLDIGATRELALRSQLHAPRMTLLGPSAAVLASVAACGLCDWFDFAADGL